LAQVAAVGGIDVQAAAAAHVPALVAPEVHALPIAEATPGPRPHPLQPCPSSGVRIHFFIHPAHSQKCSQSDTYPRSTPSAHHLNGASFVAVNCHNCRLSPRT